MAAMAGLDPTLAGVRTTEPDALTRLARQACALAGAEAAALYVRDGDDPRALVVAGAWGGRHETGSSIGVDEGLPGRVMTSGEAVIESGGAYAPVDCEGSLYGVLAVEGGTPDPGTLEDLAALAGELVARSDVRARLERTLRAGISALAELLDLRDGYTARDSGEVVELARLVGERLGLHDADLAELAVAARGHHVGKIGVPDSIL